jgi:hypothetical protein
MEMKLFSVKDTFFDNKKDAKKFRDTLEGAVVSKGPDHWRYSAVAKRPQEKKRKNRKN